MAPVTEQQIVEAVAHDLDLPEAEVAPIVHAALVQVYGEEDPDRGHIPLIGLPLTGGAGDGYPVGTRGEAAS